VIVSGAVPTAFRARRREDLLPTLHQLQRTQPDTVLRWFDRGRLWESPVEAAEALRLARQARRTRPKDWRPGGGHKDPRARFELTRDQKRARFKRRHGPRPPGETTASRQGQPPRGDRRFRSDSGRPPAAGSRPRSPRFRPPRKKKPE
jgi:hypothetical protein